MIGDVASIVHCYDSLGLDHYVTNTVQFKVCGEEIDKVEYLLLPLLLGARQS